MGTERGRQRGEQSIENKGERHLYGVAVGIWSAGQGLAEAALGAHQG